MSVGLTLVELKKKLNK